MSAGDLLGGKVFDYTHYSLVMNERRATALFTAMNMDCKNYVDIKRGKSTDG